MYQDDIDANNCQITTDEMKEMMVSKAHELFSICDVEEKGFITKRDMQRLQKELPLNPEQLENVFDSLDQDKNNFLTLEEFTEGFGSFMGMNFDPGKDNGEANDDNSVGGGSNHGDIPEKVYENEHDAVNEDEHFVDMLQNLGANGILEDHDTVKKLWLTLRKEVPELCTNFEDFIYKTSSQIKQKTTDYRNLEKVLRSKSCAHDEEVRRLYDEMENQIKSERERILKEEKMKEKLVRDEMEKEILEKDKQLQDLLSKHSKMQDRLQELNNIESESKQETEKLLQEIEEMENKLRMSDDHLDESRNYINQLRSQQRKEKQERAATAMQISQGIALERESLVKQLDILRDMNKKLRDNQDETALKRGESLQLELEQIGDVLIYQRDSLNDSHEVFNPILRSATVDDDHSLKSVAKNRKGSVLSNYFEGPPHPLNSKINDNFVESDEDVEFDELPFDNNNISQISERSPYLFTRAASIEIAIQTDDDSISMDVQSLANIKSPRPLPERGQPVGEQSTIAKTIETNSKPERIFKVVFVGDSGVGKSTFIHRYCAGSFKDTFSATIGVDFRVKQLTVDDQQVVLQLWDTAGQERYRSITKQYFRKADGVLIMYDLMNETSFLNVRNWMESVKEGADEEVVLVIVGNKLDLAEENGRIVKYKEGSRLADDFQALFFETSSKTGESLEDTFVGMAKILLEREDKQIEKAIDLKDCLEKKKKCCSIGGK